MLDSSTPQRWQRRPPFSSASLSSSVYCSLPAGERSCSATQSASKKKGVVKLFQCFLFFSPEESKSCWEVGAGGAAQGQGSARQGQWAAELGGMVEERQSACRGQGSNCWLRVAAAPQHTALHALRCLLYWPPFILAPLYCPLVLPFL
jgi:hypothetical protein